MRSGRLRLQSTSAVLDAFQAEAVGARGQIDLNAVMTQCQDMSDDVLAELIEIDGRIRQQFGRAVDLDRYLQAIPDLAERPASFDAAIDLALRSASSESRADPEAIRALCERYPAFAAMIHEAAVLNNAVISTIELRQRVTTTTAYRLPCPFGPVIEDGEPRYTLVELLGAGAFGEVYLAADRGLSDEEHEARVAIKILSPRHDNPLDRHLLTEEATKARRIDHPAVVKVLDRGTTGEDEDFIVYELVRGGNMMHWLRQREPRLSQREAAALTARIARGLQAAHAAGLIHCDLKPGNIMMSAEGEPKISDFGIAIRAGEQLQRHSSGSPGSSSSPGSPGSSGAAPLGNQAFISPEQYRCEEGSLTVASDIYALGGILYHLLTDQLPNGATKEQIALTHDPIAGRKHPPSPRALKPETARDLDAICRRAMALDPSARHASASALADDLEAWLRHEPIPWREPSIVRVLLLWARRRPAVALLAGLLMLAFPASLWFAHMFQQQANAYRLRLEALESEQVNERSQVLNLARRFADMSRADHLNSGMLAALWRFEFVNGPRILHDPALLAEVWGNRVQTVQRHLDQLIARGEGASFDAQSLRLILASWKIDKGELDAAHALAIEALTRLRIILAAAPDDAVLHTAEQFTRMLDIRLRAKHLHDRAAPLSAHELDSLRSDHDELLRLAAILGERDEGHPLLHHLGMTLHYLNGPALLNDPQAAEHARLHIHARTAFE